MVRWRVRFGDEGLPKFEFEPDPELPLIPPADMAAVRAASVGEEEERMGEVIGSEEAVWMEILLFTHSETFAKVTTERPLDDDEFVNGADCREKEAEWLTGDEEAEDENSPLSAEREDEDDLPVLLKRKSSRSKSALLMMF